MENPNKYRVVPNSVGTGELGFDVESPEIYLVCGPYALWMVETDIWGEVFMSTVMTSAKATMSDESGSVPGMHEMVQLSDIENWEGTKWYRPDLDKWQPTSDEMSGIENAIRAFTALALEWRDSGN
jgi:hypothetical protein